MLIVPGKNNEKLCVLLHTRYKDAPTLNRLYVRV